MRFQIGLGIAMLALVGAQLFAQPAGTDARTLRTWKAKCAGCHGDDGKGQTEQGKKLGVSDMTSAAWQKKFSDDQIKTVILRGIDETRDGKPKKMDAFPDLRPDQIEALVKFVRSLAN